MERWYLRKPEDISLLNSMDTPVQKGILQVPPTVTVGGNTVSEK